MPTASPPAQPQPRRLLPIKPAPIAPAPPKNLGFLSAKGNVIQLPAGLGSTPAGTGPIVLTIQQSPGRASTPVPAANIQYQVVPQIQGAQTIQVVPQAGQIQLIPGTNHAFITAAPMAVPAPTTTAVTPQKAVAVKPSPKTRKTNNVAATNVVQLPSGLTLPLNVATGEVGGAQIITEAAAAPSMPGKGKRGRKKKVVLAAQPPAPAPPPAPPQPASPPPPPPDQMETILIEAGDNIIQVLRLFHSLDT